MIPEIDETHDPALQTWVASGDTLGDFPIQNLPFGVFSPPGMPPRAGTAIAGSILDLAAIRFLLPSEAAATLGGTELNDLLALPAPARQALRRRLAELLSQQRWQAALAPHLYDTAACTLHLPARIGDYTDFYVGIHHATNIGQQFRPDNPLLPNYKWVPIGYHGRASSVWPSGVSVRWPSGQFKLPDRAEPEFGPSRRLDYELELGAWIGAGNAPGSPIPINQAEEHLSGLCLLNDWSARDLQAWEYQPLGPFLAKNFHSTISPWIVTAEALAPFRRPQPTRASSDPPPLPYLHDAADQSHGAFSIGMEVMIQSAQMQRDGIAPVTLARSHAVNMYWTVAQMIAHHTSNGCNLRPGDLLGSGTISGGSPDSLGSLMELTQGGKHPIQLPTGEQRAFLEHGDQIALRATASATGYVTIGFGECSARVG